jgi:hypothetical protein
MCRGGTSVSGLRGSCSWKRCFRPRLAVGSRGQCGEGLVVNFLSKVSPDLSLERLSCKVRRAGIAKCSTRWINDTVDYWQSAAHPHPRVYSHQLSSYCAESAVSINSGSKWSLIQPCVRVLRCGWRGAWRIREGDRHLPSTKSSWLATFSVMLLRAAAADRVTLPFTCHTRRITPCGSDPRAVKLGHYVISGRARYFGVCCQWWCTLRYRQSGKAFNVVLGEQSTENWKNERNATRPWC